MNCCHCSRNTFATIDGAALCLSCHTDFQNASKNQVSSAFQLRRGSDIADSMRKARASLIERQVKNERNTEVNNYTHNNIIVNGDNSGTLQAGKTLIQSNDIGVANLSKSGNSTVDWLTKIITKVLEIAKFCLRLIGFFK